MTFRIQVRSLHQIPDHNLLSKSQFLDLQANKTAYQSRISKLSLFYKNLSREQLESADQLNGALYFSSLFTKSVPDNLLSAAEDHVNLISEEVLRVLSQKLLRMDRWHVAERLIIKKFGPDGGEIKKFEVFALNGNFKRMIEQLPHLGKFLNKSVQFLLISVLNSKDGLLPKIESLDDSRPFNNLFQLALKGRLLSKSPPTFLSFLIMIDSLSHQNLTELEPSLLILGFNKCEEIRLDSDSLNLLKLIFSRMKIENLIILAEKLQKSKREFPEEIISLLLEKLCQHPIGMGDEITSSLLAWIIKFRPDKYDYNLLLNDYKEVISENIGRIALNSIGFHEKNPMKFIEFCLMEKGFSFDRETLKNAIDISIENFNYFPSEEFLNFIHKKGLVLSSIFYLKYLKGNRTCLNNNTFNCFKLITNDSLHGDLLQDFLSLSQDFLDLSVKSSNLDWCYKIYNSASKYQILKSLNRPKSFREFVLDCHLAGKFTKPFKSTINLDCIRAVIDCSNQNDQGSHLINEKFCIIALQAALTNLDFDMAQRLRILMNNFGYNDGGLNFSQNILQQWLRKIIK